MKSPETDPLLDLERDLPTTSEDVEALRRLRRQPSENPFEVLQRLVDQLPEAARKQSRQTSAGWEPFEL